MSLAFGAAAGAALIACAGGADGEAELLPVDAPIPASVPPGTSLRIVNGSTGGRSLQLKLAGLDQNLSFEISEWVNIGAGPDVINAFRANSLDVGVNAGIPPIQAHFQGGIDARIVAVELKREPTYVFATKPHSDIQSVGDFRGKKLAFSQGQAQGVVLLRALRGAGVKQSEVTLVPLNSPQFLTALQAGQVDVAPIAVTSIYQYLNQYARDGARSIETDAVDLLSILWAPGKVLSNPAKVAAIAAYIPLWAKGEVWQYENPDTWVQKYYVEDQRITAEQGRAVVEAASKPVFPSTWEEAIQWEQETIDLLAEGDYVEPFDAHILFDRRFEAIAANAVPEQYRS